MSRDKGLTTTSSTLVRAKYNSRDQEVGNSQVNRPVVEGNIHCTWCPRKNDKTDESRLGVERGAESELDRNLSLDDLPGVGGRGRRG